MLQHQKLSHDSQETGKASITQACPSSYLCDLLLLKGRAVGGHTPPAAVFVDSVFVENSYFLQMVGSTFKQFELNLVCPNGTHADPNPKH